MDIPYNRNDDSAKVQQLPDSAQKHNERMKKFRLAHPRIEAGAPKVAKPRRLDFIPIPLIELGQFCPN